MRKIKFRAWFKTQPVDCYFEEETPCMRYDVQDTYDCEDGTSFGELLDEDDIIIMQFTGLTDKNGKEIYEGDILKTSKYNQCDLSNIGKGQLFIVEWEKGGFNIYWRIMEQLDDPSVDYEVTGNIYEDEDLLSN